MSLWQGNTITLTLKEKTKKNLSIQGCSDNNRERNKRNDGEIHFIKKMKNEKL